MMSDEIRIYVADLAAYNNGRPHGVWIEATDDLENIHCPIAKMLSESPEGFAEEYAIHDYEGFDGYALSEYEGIESTHTVACFIVEHGELAGPLLSHFAGDLDEANTAIEEHYSGCFSSMADFAQSLTEESLKCPSIWRTT